MHNNPIYDPRAAEFHGKITHPAVLIQLFNDILARHNSYPMGTRHEIGLRQYYTFPFTRETVTYIRNFLKPALLVKFEDQLSLIELKLGSKVVNGVADLFLTFTRTSAQTMQAPISPWLEPHPTLSCHSLRYSNQNFIRQI